MVRTTAAPLLALVVAASAVAVAQDAKPALTIEGKTEYEPHDLVRLRLVGADPKAGILWDVYPWGKIQQATTGDRLLEFAAHPGTYDVQATAISQTPGGGISTLRARTTVTIKACHPPQPPTPQPPNPNPPQPQPPTPPGAGPPPAADPVQAIARISFGRAGCTAAAIWPRRADGRWNVLTAAHCVQGQPSRGTMILKDGRRIAVSVVKAEYLPRADVCWLVTDQAGLDLPSLVLAKANPAAGTRVWHAGYGVDRPGNREDGTVMDPDGWNGKTRFVLNVSSGDSGGPILRTDTNEVVSTVCCTQGKGQRTDMYGGNVASIRRLMPSDSADWEAPFGAPPDPGDDWVPIEIPEGCAPDGVAGGTPLRAGPPAAGR